MDLKDGLSDVNCPISHNWPDNADIVCDSLEISPIGTENNFSFDVELNPTYTWEETSSGSYWRCNFDVSKIPDQFNPT